MYQTMISHLILFRLVLKSSDFQKLQLTLFYHNTTRKTWAVKITNVRHYLLLSFLFCFHVLIEGAVQGQI